LEVLEIQKIGFKIKLKVPSKTKGKNKLGSKVPLEIKKLNNTSDYYLSTHLVD
jgi:hypothetical protein